MTALMGIAVRVLSINPPKQHYASILNKHEKKGGTVLGCSFSTEGNLP